MSRPVKTDSERVTNPRLSITINPDQRRKFRIAAALAGMEVGQWASGVIERAADVAIKGIKG